MKICPFCAESIKIVAIKCRYCGEWLTDDAKRPSKFPSFQSERINLQNLSKKNDQMEALPFSTDIFSLKDDFYIDAKLPNKSIQKYSLCGNEYIVWNYETKTIHKKTPPQKLKPFALPKFSNTNIQGDIVEFVKKMIAPTTKRLMDEDEEILKSAIESKSKYQNRISEIFELLLIGFFHHAAYGISFVSKDEIKSKLGFSLRVQYPEANETFLNFAKSYWSYAIIIDKCQCHKHETIGAELLLQVKNKISDIFFPTINSPRIPWKRRQEDQRSFLKLSGAKIDIEEFISGNPFLIREKVNERDLFSKLFNI